MYTALALINILISILVLVVVAVVQIWFCQKLLINVKKLIKITTYGKTVGFFYNTRRIK